MFILYHYSIDEVPCEFYYKLVPALIVLVPIKNQFGRIILAYGQQMRTDLFIHFTRNTLCR
jgi:hypothetical protein